MASSSLMIAVLWAAGAAALLAGRERGDHLGSHVREAAQSDHLAVERLGTLDERGRDSPTMRCSRRSSCELMRRSFSGTSNG